jgi:U4/U6.U5 tri-snRNP-associated protein 3
MDTTGGPVRPPARGSPAAATLPPGKAKKEEEDSKDVKMEDLDSKRPPDVDDDTWEMMKVMGFGTFKTTKNTKVPGNDKNYGVRRDKTMEARQYMNRQGGFNRPLSPSRTGL